MSNCAQHPNYKGAMGYCTRCRITELEAELEKERSRPEYSYEAQDQLAELREAALEYSYNGHSPHCKVINISVNLIKCNCGYDKLAALLQENK